MYINAYVAISHFNPRSPHGERPRAGDERGGGKAFQSTLPARGATAVAALMIAVNGISIHAPRTGSDRRSHQRRTSRRRFQSTLPARGATQRRTSRRRKQRFQSTLPARGATRRPNIVLCAKPDISIHAPRTGSDQMDSAERADYRISIHAPRTGSDLSRNAFWICAKNFNPRSPHGERQTGSENHLRDTTFQSTLPARGATGANVGNMRTSKKFQSTLPARGATASCSAESCLPRYFNPRSPHGERPSG